jgi:3-oxoacyl-[acyl-carrier-protein] synthase II
MANLTPLWLLKYLPNMLACHVTIIHDCQGPSNTITCCEASSGLSIGESLRVIQRGAADACLSGGAESKLNPMSMLRQTFAGRVAPTGDDQDPATVVRPFDPAATGTALGEGGGLVVVESIESARRRGREAYAEITGFASTQSFCPDTVGIALDPSGTGIADAMSLAMEHAGITAADVDAITPLGSSIPAVDAAEAAAMRAVLGDRVSRVPLITTIPNVGNCNAGAGAIGVAVAAQAINTQTLPARLNTAAAEGLDADACPSRPADLENVLVSQTSQGGQSVALVLKRVSA